MDREPQDWSHKKKLRQIWREHFPLAGIDLNHKLIFGLNMVGRDEWTALFGRIIHID